MNFSDVFKTLNQASAFDLYRLRASINRVLDEPRWLQAIQTRLRVGQEVQFIDTCANALKLGQVLDLDNAERWILPYACINLDGVDVQIREHQPKGLGRNEVALGDVVGFVDRDLAV